MDIGAVNVSGPMNSAPVMVAPPERTMRSSRPTQTVGGNGDVSPAQVKQMVAEMQGQLDSMNVSLQYSVYGEHGNNIAVKVVDKGTGEVIREIPAKEVQALQSKMSELVGMIFNGKG